MIEINKIFIDEEIAKAKFACDLGTCKGACCTMPGALGAPLLDKEIVEIDNSVEAAKEYLSEQSKEVLDGEGFYQGRYGNFSTIVINDRDCVFVYYDGEVAKCALEKSYFDGKSGFRKPISCHLFPIRANDYGRQFLRYEKFHECKPAIKKGNKENIFLTEFLSEPLTRAYGKEWTDMFLKYAEDKRNDESTGKNI